MRGPYCCPHRRPVAGRCERHTRVDGEIVEPGDPAERIPDDLGLQFRLRSSSGQGEVTAPTAAFHLWTRRVHPLRRRGDDLDELGPDQAGPHFGDRGQDPLVGQGTLDEDHLPVLGPGQGVTTCHQTDGGELERTTGRRWVGRAISGRTGGHGPTVGAAPPRSDTAPVDRQAPGSLRGVVNPEGSVAHAGIEIAPSVLNADFSRLGDTVVELEQAGVGRIHWDVMDGQFVPNISMGPAIIASCRPLVNLPFEAHLMVREPDGLIPAFVEAGCEQVLVHPEACTHLHRTLGVIAALGARPAVAVNPATPLSDIEWVLEDIAQVLIMTVNPGFGGQAYLPSMEPKVTALRELLDRRGLDVEIEVDGGITADTIPDAASAGASVFVVGSALFRDPAGVDHAVSEIRERGLSAITPAA
ncbi:MAG: ribulose-phosphate 3-epimerase [Actinobacteria bacterium]|nr:ribulose-phosphate 3-epimerase [Actinomycetota bacterium]